MFDEAKYTIYIVSFIIMLQSALRISIRVSKSKKTL